ncbi:MAG: hypothetical protein DWQ10_12615, partial [Calditrichaeota bacterium]
RDINNNPKSGIDVKLVVRTYTIEDDLHIVNLYGTTNSQGSVYLETLIPPELSESLYDMQASMTEADYSVLVSSSTWTNSQNYLYPYFKVGKDLDGNGVQDDLELALASKFCPNLSLHSGDNGVRPVPVEIMDRNHDGDLDWQDVIVDAYTVAGDFIDSFSPSQIYIPDMIYKQLYPYYHPEEAVLTYIDTNNDYCFSCSGDDYPPATRILHPHFEWGNLGETTPYDWYAHWDLKLAEHGNDSRFTEGTTYAHLFTSGSDIVIQYWFFYPFNACANRHESDWEHINVVIDGQDPSTAEIVKVVYYYHHEEKAKNPSEITIVNQTHPKVYVGGFIAINFEGSFYAGHGSHGSYFRSGIHYNVNDLNSNETVDGNGLVIDFDDYANIVILPGLDYVNNGNNNTNPYIDSYGNNLNWMIYNAMWGHLVSHPSAGTGLYSSLKGFLDLIEFVVGSKWFDSPDNPGNWSVPGPAQHSKWEVKGY